MSLTIACVAIRADEPTPQVLFVCEHGNVKSLMAASYFNQLAAKRGLRLRAISRGSAPDSTTVPPPIIAGLRTDGVDVGGSSQRQSAPQMSLYPSVSSRSAPRCPSASTRLPRRWNIGTTFLPRA